MSSGSATEAGPSLKDAIRRQDEPLLAALGYTQEFKRAFKPLEVCVAVHSRVA